MQIVPTLNVQGLTQREVASFMDWCENQEHCTVEFGKVVTDGKNGSVEVYPYWPEQNPTKDSKWVAFCEAVEEYF